MGLLSLRWWEMPRGTPPEVWKPWILPTKSIHVGFLAVYIKHPPKSLWKQTFSIENPLLFPSCSREAPHGRRRRWWSMVPRRATKPWRCRLSTPASPVDQSGDICGGWRFINSCFIYSHIFPCISVYIYIYSTPQNPPKIICQCYFHYFFYIWDIVILWFIKEVWEPYKYINTHFAYM
jgi:hypothetical protein